eukprot:1909065-Alexandrium_andersonii.AAC.1
MLSARASLGPNPHLVDPHQLAQVRKFTSVRREASNQGRLHSEKRVGVVEATRKAFAVDDAVGRQQPICARLWRAPKKSLPTPAPP